MNIGCPFVPGEDPVAYMQRDHAEIRAMLRVIRQRLVDGRPKAATRLLRQARCDIMQHFTSEEDEVFPRWATRYPELKAALDRRIAEHPSLRRELNAVVAHPSMTTLARFVRHIETHAQDEDRLFGI